MIAAPEDQRAAEAYAQEQEEQQDLFNDLDQMDEQVAATIPANRENLEDGEDAELAADEKIRQREELLEETAV
jgi:hypothetical protein